MTDGGGFDATAWARLVRDCDFDGARAVVSRSLRDGGPSAVAEIAAYYRTLGGDRGWVLLSDLDADVADTAALTAFYEQLYADEAAPYAHRGLAVQGLARLRAPGYEEKLVADLGARSEERRLAALHWLARRGTPACVEPVTDRSAQVLRKPAFVGSRDGRYRGELLPAFVAVLRCAERQQVVRFAQQLRLRQAHLSGVELSWLRDLWPGAIDEPLHAPVPEPGMDRVMAWTRGEVQVDLRGWVHPPDELVLGAEGAWDCDPPVVDRT